MQNTVIEVEVDVDRNRNLYFVPLDRAIRGRFDWRRVADKNGPELRDRWGEEPLPGQTISLDLAKGEGAILEPLCSRAEIKKRVETRGESLSAERQSFTDINPKEWLYWLKAAVKAGKAKLLRGEIPENVDYKPKRFGEVKTTTDRLTEALIAVLHAGLSDKQRKEVSDLVVA